MSDEIDETYEAVAERLLESVGGNANFLSSAQYYGMNDELFEVFEAQRCKHGDQVLLCMPCWTVAKAVKAAEQASEVSEALAARGLTSAPATVTPSSRECDNCNASLEGMSERARFCSEKCRKAYARSVG